MTCCSSRRIGGELRGHHSRSPEIIASLEMKVLLCPLLHPCCRPARFNICSANKQNIEKKPPPPPPFPHRLIHGAAVAPPEIRMFIYGHQYLIGFTLIWCWWVQKSPHGCLNIKINWSPDTVKRLEVIVLGEQVASRVVARIYCKARARACTHALSPNELFRISRLNVSVRLSRVETVYQDA